VALLILRFRKGVHWRIWSVVLSSDDDVNVFSSLIHASLHTIKDGHLLSVILSSYHFRIEHIEWMIVSFSSSCFFFIASDDHPQSVFQLLSFASAPFCAQFIQVHPAHSQAGHLSF